MTKKQQAEYDEAMFKLAAALRDFAHEFCSLSDKERKQFMKDIQTKCGKTTRGATV